MCVESTVAEVPLDLLYYIQANIPKTMLPTPAMSVSDSLRIDRRFRKGKDSSQEFERLDLEKGNAYRYFRG